MRSRKQSDPSTWRASPSPDRADTLLRSTRTIGKIVSEEIDAWGTKKYEVQWLGRQGAELTDTTWEYFDPSDLSNAIESWEDSIANKRMRLAHTSYEVPLPDHHVPLYDYATFEAAHALEQKQKRSTRHSLSRYRGWDSLVHVPYRCASSPTCQPQSQGSRSNLFGEDQDQGSREVAPYTTTNSPHTERIRRKAVDNLDFRPHKKQNTNSSPHIPKSSVPFKSVIVSVKDATRASWRYASEQAGAARISIVNEVTGDFVPPLPRGFRYIESKYILPDCIPQPDPGFLVACDCTVGCQGAEGCDCQDVAGTDENGQKTHAYDINGFYKFDRSGVIVECSKGCSCMSSCPNRVAQHPRDVPLQVFRTTSCGWGVRATIELSRGKFIGLYAGLLILRSEADKVTGEHKSYIFDLDAMETEVDDSEGAEKYSVDAYDQGNWSRFINHSCEPNMEVLSVVWDTPPSMNRPYLAFFATKYIPAFTELTIDYDPRASWDIGANSKAKKVVGKGNRKCMCGTGSCRGYMLI
ncbi:hypothetical protein BDY19DRAFT_992979 [Irpex rosettiformis]|uniref:Uncharacterized protein n=1 Tax=Irpex rosettiformis TaxID=378272 RepID=A0ACB8U739_9APHY|nr:hypothetical protein BDY19DRAFT_992979 [Irpex rosettiformis]